MQRYSHVSSIKWQKFDINVLWADLFRKNFHYSWRIKITRHHALFAQRSDNLLVSISKLFLLNQS
jgi:hypothetical protein